MEYELVIVGAGPAGLMTARSAAERGLKTLIVELKQDITQNLRLCASVLYIKPGFHGDSEVLEKDRIIFVENDFSVKYDGGYEPIYEWFYLSPGGKRFRMGKKNYPAAWGLDKRRILELLLQEVQSRGVTICFDSAVLKVENIDGGTRALVKQRGADPKWIEAKACVISDGISSRTTTVSFPEVWRKRTHLAEACGVGYLVDNVQCSWGEHLWGLCKNRFGSAYFLPTPMRSARGRKIWKVLGFSTDPLMRQDNARKALTCLLEEQPTAQFFKEIDIIKRASCAWDFYSPIPEPAIGRTLLVGDVCAMQEVDIQGALACGFRAGNAVSDELEGKKGYQEYTDWWKNAFEFNRSDDPTRHLAKGFGLFALGSDVLDYWFSLQEHGVINSFIDHNNLGALLQYGFERNRATMERERPDVVKKLDCYFGSSAEEAYRGSTRST